VCDAVLKFVGKCELEDAEHKLDSEGRQVHRHGHVTWNGGDKGNEINLDVRPGAVVTAVIGEVDGRFLIWHMTPGEQSRYVVEADNPLVITLRAKC
jgi:hypothetical protein